MSNLRTKPMSLIRPLLAVALVWVCGCSAPARSRLSLVYCAQPVLVDGVVYSVWLAPHGTDCSLQITELAVEKTTPTDVRYLEAVYLDGSSRRVDISSGFHLAGFRGFAFGQRYTSGTVPFSRRGFPLRHIVVHSDEEATIVYPMWSGSHGAVLAPRIGSPPTRAYGEVLAGETMAAWICLKETAASTEGWSVVITRKGAEPTYISGLGVKVEAGPGCTLIRWAALWDSRSFDDVTIDVRGPDGQVVWGGVCQAGTVWPR